MDLDTMISKKYTWATLAMSVCLSAVLACSKVEDPQQPSRPSIEQTKPQGELVQLDLSGEYLAQQTSEARYISTASEKGIKLTLSAQEIQSPKKLRLFLVQEEKPDVVTSVYVTPKITELSTGKYRITYKGEVQLQGQGQSFATGTWYIGGVYGYEEENNDASFGLPGGKSFIFLGNGDSADLELPLTLGWTRLYTRKQPAEANDSGTKATPAEMSNMSPDLGRNFALSYKPDGILLRVRSINGLLSPTPISHVMVETNEFSAGAAKYPAVSGLTAAKLKAGGSPSPLTAVNVPTNNLYRIEVEVPTALRFLEPGQAISKDVYIWLHETGRTYDENTKTQLWLNANGQVATRRDKNGNIVGSSSATWGTDWPIEKRLLGITDQGNLILEDYSDYDKADQGGRKNKGILGAIRYRLYGGDRTYLLPKRTAAAGYTRGTIYPANLEATSDLILSEVFVEKAYNRGSSTPLPSYALLEIYNPSLREIDLSSYGLSRIFTKDEAADRYICPGVPTPSGKQPGDVVDKALVLPLNPVLGYGAKWAKNGLGVRPDGAKWDVNGAFIQSTPLNYEGYNITYRDYAQELGANPLTTSSTLAPGKTMIVLSSKYLLDDSYKPNVTQDAYRTVGNERVPEVFKQIKQAVDQGYCQYVFAVNNAKDKNAAPNASTSGVMTVGLVDFFSIVKVKSGSEQRTIVDSDWLYVWSPDMEQERKFFAAVGGNGKSYVRKRRLPLLGNNSLLFSQDYLNRTAYEVGGSTNYSTFGVAEYNEYLPDWNYATRIQPLVNRKETSKIK